MYISKEIKAKLFSDFIPCTLEKYSSGQMEEVSPQQ